MKEHGAELGIDTGRVGIGGPSGGGGLAAALALLVRDRGEFDGRLPAADLPDDRRPPGPAPTANWDVPVWNPDVQRRSAGRPTSATLFGTDDVPSHAAAARATDLSGLPPTFIMVGSLDGFADEDIDYARRLNHAGVPGRAARVPGRPHGFEGFAPGAAVARQARRDINEWLGARLGR